MFGPRRTSRETIRYTTAGKLFTVWRWDLRVANDMLDSIVFFYGNEHDAENGRDPVGTGFCVWVADQDQSFTHIYVVTNEHVIRASAPLHFVRPTSPIASNGSSLSLSEYDWLPHPDGDDIAVCYLGCDVMVPFGALQAATALISREQVAERHAGIGDDCVMIGCFSPHSGTRTNLPVVRFGNISMMPVEAIWVAGRSHFQECFLVEMRSRNGFSGSPVYLLPSLTLNATPSFDPDRNETLGICCGHLNEPRAIHWTDPHSGQAVEAEVDENSGMAMVIPGWKIRDFLFSDELIAIRKQAESSKKPCSRDAPRVHAPTSSAVHT